MTLLNEEDGWKLFAEYAFRNKDDSMWTNLESIGKKIVEKCKGLPLAIKTLGGLLHTKSSEKQWNDILNSEIWQLLDDESDVIPALRLSYHYLPSNLKQCFAFCSIFPKDHKIEKDSLIQMWMAEDLLHCNQGNKNVEEMGSQILVELELRSFLQKSKIHNRYVMHDLINDLAKSISEEFCLRIEDGKVKNIHKRIRYLSYSALLDSNEMLLEPFYECKQLRCFVSFKRAAFSFKEGMDEGEILSKFKYLRILSLKSFENITKSGVGMNNSKHLRYLDLSDTRIEKLPCSICKLYNLQTLKLCGCTQVVELPPDLHKLVDLHYLDLSKTKISKLPDSLFKLHNLQTLKLQACQYLVELPPGLQNLINLHHLDISWTSIREMPNNMGRLKHLQILTSFYVGKHGGSNLKELGKLNYLQGSLEISKLENINDIIDAREAHINDKKYLYKLDLQWSGNNEDSQRERFTLEGLQPHVNLKELAIRNFGGTRFADWFDAPYLPNLVSLVLRACKYCFCLPPLGQLPSLKSVHISKLEGLKKIGLEFYGNNNLSCVPFPSLEYLFIAGMLELKEWIHFDGACFPCLKEIVIRYCPWLRKSLPPHMPCLEKLEIEQCGNLELESFPTKAFSTPKLESIHLAGLTHLKSLHEDMHTLLPCVHSLSLFHCPQLLSVPQKGLPLSLVQVSIHDCPKLFASRMSWGLHRLHSLHEFSIGENFETVESFPEEGLLPSNLKVIRFEGFSNLIRINSSGLLPLTSLQGLRIYNCPNLLCLPEEGLSRSISYLVIDGNCPFLTQRYQKNGQEWHKISHIPWVCIS
ncbi:putative disease resistance protein At3g14460 isoform X2 [Prosopis cineraria]|uniref:putative disease resistance protein At3g14460 isoform X2 n=1 Tax=Prosopis cineraria TaxID=364024 RepID=UPI00240F3E92|nr:putative disease resistance protein At3g14460 isoform X2 [Prosopis cineraria]XP_054813802.1 putative disease resistance protein At3g14460 isoform X2 [Prosopis cineraria]